MVSPETAVQEYKIHRMNKDMKKYVLLLLIAVAFVGACGKRDEKVTDAPQPSVMKPGEPVPPTEPTPPLPAPDVPKNAPTDLPKPGQNNDHSSPAFKGGGKSDKAP